MFKISRKSKITSKALAFFKRAKTLLTGEYKHTYIISDASLKKLKGEEVPEEVLVKLKNLKKELGHESVTGKETFLEILRTGIGEEMTRQYELWITEHTHSPKTFLEAVKDLISNKGKADPLIDIRPQLLRVSNTLHTIDAYFQKAKENKSGPNSEYWEILTTYIDKHLPPRGYLVYFQQKAEQAQSRADYLDHFENMFQKIYQELEHCFKKAKLAKDKQFFKHHKKQLLKLWQRFAIRLEEPFEEALVALIIEDDTENSRWIRFCIPHLHKTKFVEKLPPAFLERLRKLIAVELTDVDTSSNGLSQTEKRIVKSVFNTQLALLNQQKFAWAHLNIARLLLVKDMPGNKTQNVSDMLQEGKALDEYLDWQIEQAVKAGVQLSDIDLILAAYAQLLKKNYPEVINLLEEFGDTQEEQLVIKCKLMLATAYGSLWLVKDKRGDGLKALVLLQEMRDKKVLPDTEHFLLCQLLYDLKGSEEAQREFAALNIHRIKAEKIEIIRFAWQIKAFDKIEPFLKNSLKETPDSVEFLSLLCELYRFQRNKFAEANKLIASIEKSQPDHPWVVVKQCTDLLDKGNLDNIEAQISKLPDTEVWSQEACILKGRMELKTGAVNKAKTVFTKIKFKDRIDYKYWNAVIHAYNNKINLALRRIAEIPDDAYFQEQVTALQGQLLLAQGKYQEALESFNSLADGGDFTIYKAWAFLKLKRYKEALDLLKNEVEEEALYLKAQLYDLSGEAEKAYERYKQFIQTVPATNHYIDSAIDRFSCLVIEKEAMEDAHWLLTEKHLAGFLSTKRLINLHALQKNWNEVIKLLAQKEEVGTNNLMFAYQQLLFSFIKDKNWQAANEMIEKLSHLEEPVNEYKDFLLRAEFLDNIQKMEQKVDYQKLEKEQDESLQIAVVLHKFIHGKESFPQVYQKLETWAEKNATVPEPTLLLLIISLFEQNAAKSQQLVKKLQPLLNRINDEDIKLIAQVFIALASDMQTISTENLMQIFTSFHNKLPITPECFWQRVILSLAKQDIRQAIEVIGNVENDITFASADKAAIYAQSALQNLKAGQEQAAVENLVKAIGA